jgi:glutamate synthase (NADPH/NADH) large chain
MEKVKKKTIYFWNKLRGFRTYFASNGRGAKEATGSMGDDTPLAVLSDKYRPLYHFLDKILVK